MRRRVITSAAAGALWFSASILGGLLVAHAASSTTFFVNSVRDDPTAFPFGSTGDATPGDATCFTGRQVLVGNPAVLAPECTLRAAIEESNALAGFDDIEFSSNLPVPSFPDPNAGYAIFKLDEALPMVTDTVRIDGTTAPSWSPSRAPVIQIDGSAVSGHGLLIARAPGFPPLPPPPDGSEVIALALHSFSRSGIVVIGAESVRIEACHLGIHKRTQAAGNGQHGIRLASNSSSSNDGSILVENTIGFNLESGVQVAYSEGISLVSNWIGTDSLGRDLGNGLDGVDIVAGLSIQIGPFPAAPAAPELGNTIAHNGRNGISVCTVEGNVSGCNDPWTSASISQNSIHSNAGLGIDIHDSFPPPATGPNPNDVDDIDEGANRLMNHPDAPFATYDPATSELVIPFELSVSESSASYPLVIDAYLADPDLEEGMTWLGRHFIPFEFLLSDPAIIDIGSFGSGVDPLGQFIVLTTSDEGGNTSEFGPAVPVPEAEVAIGLLVGIAALWLIRRGYAWRIGEISCVFGTPDTCVSDN